MRPFTILATIMLVSLYLLPSAVAADTTYEYVVAPSAGVGDTGIGIYPCGGGCDLDGDGQNDYPFDHGPFTIPAGHTNVIISAEDLVWGDAVAMSVCWFNPDGDDVCSEDDNTAGPGCGQVALLGSPFSGGSVQIHLIGILVQDDLTVCGATTGTITIHSS